MRAASASTCRRRACWRRCWRQLWPSTETGRWPSRWSRSRWLPASTSGPPLGGDGRQPAALAGADRPGRLRSRAASAPAGACRRGGPCQTRPSRRRRAAPPGNRAGRARYRRADRHLGGGRPHAAARHPAICRRPACWPISRNPPSARTPAEPSWWPCARSGRNGAEGANILALGDAVRALKRSGLEAGRPPPGARSAVRGLAAHAGQLTHVAQTQRQLDRPVPGDAGGGAGRRRQHAAGLSARPRRFSGLSRPRDNGAGRPWSRPISPPICARCPRADWRRPRARAGCRRSGSCSSSWPAKGVVAEDPAHGLAGPKKARALPKTLSVAEVDRLIEAARARIEPAKGRDRVRALQALCADRDAVRHRHARDRARDAAALGAGGRRPRAGHQGQGRPRAPRAAEPGGAGGARALPQRRPCRGRRGADAADQVAVRLARRGGALHAPAPRRRS